MKTFFSLVLCIVCIPNFAQVTQIRDTILMGSKFQLTVVDQNEVIANKNIDKAIDEIVRIEYLISDWKTTSQVSLINNNAGVKPVVVDKELIDLIKRSISYSEISNGAFDITFAAMDRIWKFDGSMDELPSDKEIKNAIRNIGYNYIKLDTVDNSVFLEKKGMKIGFGSIGKGYAADKAKEVLKGLKVISGIVDASGDLATFGEQVTKEPWRIGITNPIKSHKLTTILELRNAAVTTSGDYQKYVFIGNQRYSHIINPKTGWPSTGVTSVTIIGASAEVANAFSTASMVLGVKDAKKMLAKYPNYGGIFITDRGKVMKTKGFKRVLKNLRN